MLQGEQNRESFRFQSLSLSLFVLSSFLLIGCENIFAPMSSADTNEALLYSARMHTDRGEWTEALEDFDQMTADYLAQREVKVFHASVYAGRCGLDFIQLLTRLEQLSTQKLFEFLFQSYPGGTAQKQADCVSAEALLKEIGGTAARNRDENFLMAMLSLVKIGVVLNKAADADLDGVVDATFDPCASDALTDDDAKEVGTGLVIFANSLSQTGQSSAVADAFQGVCDLFGTSESDPFIAYKFCDKENVADITTAEQVLGIRTFVKDGAAIGLGAILTPACTTAIDLSTPATPQGCICFPGIP